VTENDADLTLARSPHWFPHALDLRTDALTLLWMEEKDYRAASFLDQRIVGAMSRMRTMKWREAEGSIDAGGRRDAQFIFHIGNVGSTLISRLLGELEGVFALREPLLLRTFFEALGPLAGGPWTPQEAARRLDTLRALVSRTFRGEQRAIVKATSFTSEIAPRLVPAGSAVLLLFATPQHYVENILAGDNSRQTAELMAPSRLKRLQGRCPGLSLDLTTLPPARKAALGWACEMTSLEAAAAELSADQPLWLDFDRFLNAPAEHFMAIARHFRHSPALRDAAAICAGPLMRRYSKAPEYEYSPELRREIMADAGWRHRPAIRDALAWLNALAERYPKVAQAIGRAQKAS
jgi:hypothetical protein